MSRCPVKVHIYSPDKNKKSFCGRGGAEPLTARNILQVTCLECLRRAAHRGKLAVKRLKELDVSWNQLEMDFAHLEKRAKKRKKPVEIWEQEG